MHPFVQVVFPNPNHNNASEAVHALLENSRQTICCTPAFVRLGKHLNKDVYTFGPQHYLYYTFLLRPFQTIPESCVSIVMSFAIMIRDGRNKTVDVYPREFRNIVLDCIVFCIYEIDVMVAGVYFN